MVKLYEPKRKKRLQLKLEQTIEMAKMEADERAKIVKEALASAEEEIITHKRRRVDEDLTKEGRQLQREAQTAIYDGLQGRLPDAKISDAEVIRQKKNAEARQMA